MSYLLIVLVVLAVLFLGIGFFVSALKWALVLGIVFVVVAAFHKLTLKDEDNTTEV